MNKKISVFYDHILQGMEQSNITREELLKKVKMSGIDALEINYTHLKRDYKSLMEELNEIGLAISCVFETYDLGNKPLWTPIKKQIDLAKKVGAFKVLIIPGFLTRKEADMLNDKSASYEETTIFMNANEKIQNMKQVLIKAVAYGISKDIEVTLEDYDGYVAPFARMYQLKWFMINVPGLKYTLDMGNFAYSDEDVNKAFQLLQKYIIHTHCKDRGIDPATAGEKVNKGLKPAPCGSGYLPIKELVLKLIEDGYDGYFAIEHYEAPDQVEFMIQSAAFLRSF